MVLDERDLDAAARDLADGIRACARRAKNEETLRIGASSLLKAAAAREYRETLAIEKAMKENPEKGHEWLDQQEVYVSRATTLEEEPDAVSARAVAT